MKAGRSTSSSALSRRQFLLRAGAAGGSAAVLSFASALGLMAGGANAALPSFSLAALSKSEKRPTVAIIGAGIGGLVAAYELDRAGYNPIILEASHRIGGRNLTARRGTLIDELGNPQRCDFDDHPDMYFNCGPARIPGTHHRLLSYCRAFGISLENFVNENPNAYVQSADFNGGKAMRQRQYLADAKGFLSEFAAKAVSDPDLDAAISNEDLEKLEAFVRRFGDLGKDKRYHGSQRAGFETGGLLRPGELKSPTKSLNALLESPYWQYQMFFAEGETQFPAMLQPVGGMDKIVDAFVARVGDRVVMDAQVTRLTVTSDGVTIGYSQAGKPRTLEADYCLNSMPGHLVYGLDHNLPDDMTVILREMRGVKLSKVGLQMKSRFWESDQIYGGITWTDKPWLQIWYPSHGTFNEKGVLLGGYTFGKDMNDKVACMTPDQRIETALSMGEDVHPGQYRANFEKGITVAWQNYNHMLGCGSGLDRGPGDPHTAEDNAKIARLQKPVKGRYFMIGDQVSYHPGWQEGAIAVSQQALQHIEANKSAIHV